ncbi:type II toxin-antitoxin system RnlA family toxin [Desulfuromonas sp. TF]|uniref:type II toxin-antitoxin system RnlA family toxin n=1 Tax=Desulfuromonas sp. TF TaxID=1232410 RepID=UPI0004060F2C|nr:type II toxin-antitoxin system RnlA family toxin [Desulfuromonas sp. TF]
MGEVVSHKSLAINRDRIKPTLEGYSEFATITGPRSTGKFEEYIIKTPGQPDALLHIYFLKDGATTINPKVGKNQKTSHELADLIKEKCSVRETNRGNLSLKNVSKDNFNIMLDFVKDECEAKIESIIDLAHGQQFKIRGRQNDVLSINYFNNGSLSIQGKPLLIYTEVIEILCELLPYKDIVASQLRVIDTDISEAEVTDELEAKIPNAHPFLGSKVKAILAPALAYQRVAIEFSDYTSMTFPALKGLEGYLKLLFLEHNITISREGFGDRFRGDPSQLVPDTQQIISCDKTCRAIEKVYDYFRKQRHGLFHVDGTPATTRIIKNRLEADQIINDSLALIEETYTSIKS